MKVIVSEELTPQYFTMVYRSKLKRVKFDAWYRGARASRRLKKAMIAMLKLNDEFFRENPDYVEGAICGRLKEKK